VLALSADSAGGREVERLTTEEESGVISPQVLNRTPEELRRGSWKQRRQMTDRTGSGWHRIATAGPRDTL